MNAVNSILNLLSGRLGLDHDRVLAGRFAIPVMCRRIALHEGKLGGKADQDRLLHWYIHSFLWGRYAGSTETVLNQDLLALAESTGDFDALLRNLRQSRGDLTVRPEDFAGYSLGARFYPMLYLLSRVLGAKDWGNGLPLSLNMLGRLNSLEVHHIFPKALLYKAGYDRESVNAVANFCLLTRDTNLDISNKNPEIYFHEIEARHPGALASQWIPLDQTLWTTPRYRDFLEARRVLLAQAANGFLTGLLTGQTMLPIPAGEATQPVTAHVLQPTLDLDDPELSAFLAWVAANQLPMPDLDAEIADQATGKVIAIADIAWIAGVQPGKTPPCAVVRACPPSTEARLTQAGFRVFSAVTAAKSYIEAKLLGER